MLGGALGPTPDGPGPGDLSAPQINLGSQIPRVYGRVRCPVNPIWISEFRATEVSAGGGKGSPEGPSSYTYSLDMLGLVADGSNVVAITRIWVNKKLVYTALNGSANSSLVASSTTDYWEEFEFFDGNAAQVPWAVYETAVTTAKAVAYRHQATVGITGLQCGGSKTPPLVEVEVVTAATGSYNPTGPGGLVGSTSGASSGGGGPLIMPNGIQAGDALIALIMSESAPGGALVDSWADYIPGELVWPLSGGAPSTRFYLRTATGDSGDDAASFTSGSVLWTVVALRGVTDIHWPSTMTRGLSGSDANQYGTGVTKPFGEHMLLSYYSLIATFGYDAHIVSAPGDCTLLELVDLTPPDNNFNMPPHGLLFAQMGVAYTSYTGTTYNAGPWYVPGSYGGGGSQEWEFAITYSPEGTATGYTPTDVDLATIVQAEHDRNPACTPADIDVTDLVGIMVTGFKAIGPSASTIAQLADIYYFDVVPGNPIRCQRRGTAAVGAIPFADTGVGVDGPGEPFTGLKRGNNIELPAVVGLAYPNLSQDHEPGYERGDRLTTDGPDVRRIQTTVVLTPTQAKGRSIAATLDSRAQAHTATVPLSDKYAKLEPGDTYTLNDDDGNAYNLRALRLGYSDGVKTIDWALDDTTALVETGITSEDYTPSMTVAAAGTAEGLPLDIPLQADANDRPGYYAAVKTSDESSARFMESADNVTYSTAYTFTTDAVFGSVTAIVGSFPAENLWDEGSSITVNVGNGTLTTSTRAALLADRSVNAFAVGVDGRWCLGQFRTATLVSAGVYTLTGLLLGAKGTEQYAAGITVADDFCLLTSSALQYLPRATSLFGVAHYWKVVPQHKAASAITGAATTVHGISLKPLSPVALRVFRDVASGAIEVDWTRRTRMDTRFGGPLGDSCPLGEATESYDVVLHNGDTVLASDTVTEPRWSVSGRVVLPAYAGGNFTTQCGSEYVALTDAYPLATNVAINRYASDGTFLWGINLGGQAVGLATNGTEAYVATIDGSNPALLRRISAALIPGPTSGNILATYTSTIGNLRGVAFDGTYVWASEFYSSNLLKLDATTLVVANTYAISSAALGAIAADGAGSIWMCSAGSPNQLIQWSIGGAAEVRRVDCASQANGLLIAHGLLFVAEAAGIVVRDATTGAMINGTEGVGASYRPNLAHLSDGTVVACDRAASQLIYLDDTTGAEVMRVDVPNLWEVAGGVDDKVFAAVRGSGSTMLSKVFGPLPDPTGYSLTVYQNSAVVGRGYPATLEIA